MPRPTNSSGASSTTDGDCPLKFYKYKSLAGDGAGHVEQIICQNVIYFPAPLSFNDPFDCRSAFSFEGTDDDLLRDYMRLARKHGPPTTDAELRQDATRMLADPSRNPRNPAVRAAIEDEHARRITSEVGVLCVSTISDDILMWSHYADSHRGICLEFDGRGKFMAHAQKVLYAGEKQLINPYRDQKGVATEKALLTKSDHWSYEREWRLIRYRQGPGAIQFRPKNLTGIIVGCQASSETVRNIQKWASTSVSPIKLYHARANRYKYALDMEDLL